MSDIEGNAGGRHEREPDSRGILFDYEDIGAFEPLLHEDGSCILARASSLSRPLDSVQVSLDVLGSEYWLQTSAFLRDEFKKNAPAYDRFSGLLENAFDLIPDEEDDYDPRIVIMSEGGYAYVLWQDTDKGELVLQTLGTYEGTSPSVLDKLNKENDIFEVAFDDFIQTTEEVIDMLHEAYDKNPGDRKIYLKPVQEEEQPEHTKSVEVVAVEEAKPPVEGLVIESSKLPRLNDIAGLDAEKEELFEHVVTIQHPDIMAKWGVIKRPSGILLYGPQGTGKTTLAKAVAGELGAQLVLIDSTFYGTYMGQSEKNFKAILDWVEASMSPTLLLFDELDGIITNAGSAYQTVKAMFKQRIGTITENNPNVAVIATTNNKDKIDQTIIRDGRFDVKLYIPEPKGPGALSAIFGKILERSLFNDSKEIEREVFKAAGGDIDIAELADAAEGWTGANVVALFEAVKTKKAVQEALTGEIPNAITHQDLLDAIRHRRTRM